MPPRGDIRKHCDLLASGESVKATPAVRFSALQLARRCPYSALTDIPSSLREYGGLKTVSIWREGPIPNKGFNRSFRNQETGNSTQQRPQEQRSHPVWLVPLVRTIARRQTSQPRISRAICLHVRNPSRPRTGLRGGRIQSNPPPPPFDIAFLAAVEESSPSGTNLPFFSTLGRPSFGFAREPTSLPPSSSRISPCSHKVYKGGDNCPH
ncbi:hypothetical protein LZ30DRAFT_219081 [Colletotrichum cereale]|nr:hypothetical protein LZ30DRAFT_219081 [Colletotrichum cereale]